MVSLYYLPLFPKLPPKNIRVLYRQDRPPPVKVPVSGHAGFSPLTPPLFSNRNPAANSPLSSTPRTAPGPWARRPLGPVPFQTHLAEVARGGDLGPSLFLLVGRILARREGFGRPGELLRRSVEPDPEVEPDEARQHVRQPVPQRAPDRALKEEGGREGADGRGEEWGSFFVYSPPFVWPLIDVNQPTGPGGR